MTETKKIEANGIQFSYLEKGLDAKSSDKKRPLVLCFHGFPDTAYTFEQTLSRLEEAGYWAVAPFMRGYYPSSLAPDDDYSTLRLAEDVLALIDAFGVDDAIVIGHDWGGFAAYTAANMQPEKISKLVVMCIPHMNQTVMSWQQLKKSWYVFYFQLPWVAERKIPENNYQFIDQLYRTWSPYWRSAEFALEPVKKALSMPGGLTALIGYYRAMIRNSTKQQRDLMTQQTDVPTLFFAGEADGSVGMDQFASIEKAFANDFEFVSYPGVGHFPHRENFEEFAAKVLAFLTGPG